MKRISQLVVVAALAAVGVISLLAVAPQPAAATEIKWDLYPVKWDTTGTPLIKTIGDETDTSRTLAINLRTIAWDAFDASTTVGCGPRVFFAIEGGTNTATDTIYYQAEIGVNGIWNYAGSIIAETPTVYNSALTNADAGGNIWSGCLQIDRDALGEDNVYQVPEIRLKVQGDQSGSSAKVTKVRCWIYAPWRAVSGPPR